MRIQLGGVAVMACLAMLAGGCGGDDDEGGGGGGGEPIKVGGIFDLTGPTSDVGVAYADGIKDRVDQVNREGGVDGREIELISDDYAYEVPQAEQLYSRLKSEQVVAIQGWGTGDTEALSPRIAQDKIPYLSASYSENVADPAEAPYNFVPGMTYSDQMRAVLDYIAEEAGGPTEVAVFHNDSPFGESPLEDGRAHIEEQGYEIGFETYAMPAEATDYASELSRAKSQGAEWIVIQNVATPSAQLAKDVKRQGLDAQIVCLVYCSDEVYTKLAGDAAEGTIGVFPFAPVSDDVPGLIPAAEAIGGEKKLADTHVHYVQGYYTMDAMLAGIQAALESGDELTGESLKAALEEAEPLDTGEVSAPLDWTAERHAGLDSARLYEFKDGKWTRLTDDFVSPAG
jgi:branched-chain amino acid transport system substrate-binding protein